MTEHDLTNRPGKTQRTVFGLDPSLEKVYTTKFDKLDLLLGFAVDDAPTSFLEGHIVARFDKPPDRGKRHVNLHVGEIET